MAHWKVQKILLADPSLLEKTLNELESFGFEVTHLIPHDGNILVIAKKKVV